MIADNTYKLQYKKDYNVVMLNEIIKGKQTMTLQEAKLIRLLITQIVKEDKDFKTYTISIKNLAEYLNIADSNLYRDIKNICDTLMSRVIKLSTGDSKKPWKTIQWLQLAEYDGNGIVKLMLSNQMQPYILGLNSWFTKYPIGEIFSMSSFYAIRIYELISMEKNILQHHSKQNIYNIVFDIFYLRQALECENKFKQIGQFKEKVINVSVKEINQYTDISINYECIKTSRKITGIKFIVQENFLEQNKPNNLEQKSNNEFYQPSANELDEDELMDELRLFIVEPLKIKDLRILLKTANNDLQLIKSKYELAQKQNKIENLTAWLISAIENDFSEPISRRKKNKFINYEQGDWDFEKLAQLEKEYIDKKLSE